MSDIRFNQWLHNSGTGGVSQVDGGHVGIGTTNPEIAVHSGNNKILNVGIVTASTYYGDGSNLTGLVGGATGLDLNDNIKIRLGNSQDFQLYHDGNNSLIQDSGTGHVQVRSGTFTIGNLTLSKTSAVFNSGGGQQLNFNNNQKFITTNTGVIVSGICTATSFSGDGSNLTGLNVDATALKDGSGNVIVQASATAVSVTAGKHVNPASTNTTDLGTTSLRWRNLYTQDLQLSNESSGGNDVDGTWGNYTIQEGESDLFLINNRSGKKYKFLLQEVT